jgi:hypothetical protein
MKTINNVQVWKDGEEKQASILNAVLENDDLGTNANFYYQLLSSENEKLIDGKISMVGEDYQNWDDSNDGAYDYIANKLNLTIIA